MRIIKIQVDRQPATYRLEKETGGQRDGITRHVFELDCEEVKALLDYFNEEDLDLAQR